MKQFNAFGNYERATYEIGGLDGCRHEVPECREPGNIKTDGPGAYVLVVDKREETLPFSSSKGKQKEVVMDELSWLGKSVNRSLWKVIKQAMGKMVLTETKDSAGSGSESWVDEGEETSDEESKDKRKDSEY